jgi:toxin secretion/phage lysis holin
VDKLLIFAEHNPLFAALLIFMVFDVLSGLGAAAVQRKLSSPISYAGMSRKFLIIIMIFTAQMMDWIAVKLFFVQTPIAGAVLWFFIIREIISITENAVLGGLPIPPVIKDRLAVLQQTDIGKVIAITGGLLQTAPADPHVIAATIAKQPPGTTTNTTLTASTTTTTTTTTPPAVDDSSSNQNNEVK